MDPSRDVSQETSSISHFPGCERWNLRAEQPEEPDSNAQSSKNNTTSIACARVMPFFLSFHVGSLNFTASSVNPAKIGASETTSIYHGRVLVEVAVISVMKTIFVYFLMPQSLKCKRNNTVPLFRGLLRYNSHSADVCRF